ncbi:hypothetical protein JQC91_06235 [Jannaschia sp. Os4]|uniref:hypothetical protein n=1 Tax=Jannaschia sp. Os4 TaxID=2807617 RepID=UPI00193ABB05|nr:hypothetical protein [Jannaschia sp. Os4]MBM2575896.1 hypothetical protein [Jannaschia sp. Os4]
MTTDPVAPEARAPGPDPTPEELRAAVRSLSLDLDRAEARMEEMRARLLTERELARRQAANLRSKVERLTEQLDEAAAAGPARKERLLARILRRAKRGGAPLS